MSYRSARWIRLSHDRHVLEGRISFLEERLSELSLDRLINPNPAAQARLDLEQARLALRLFILLTELQDCEFELAQLPSAR